MIPSFLYPHFHVVQSDEATTLSCVSLQGVDVSDMLAKCKSIRAFELCLTTFPECLTALSSCLEEVCRSSSTESLSVSCLDAGQWCPALGLLLCRCSVVHISHGIECQQCAGHVTLGTSGKELCQKLSHVAMCSFLLHPPHALSCASLSADTT